MEGVGVAAPAATGLEPAEAGGAAGPTAAGGDDVEGVCEKDIVDGHASAITHKANTHRNEQNQETRSGIMRSFFANISWLSLPALP